MQSVLLQHIKPAPAGLHVDTNGDVCCDLYGRYVGDVHLYHVWWKPTPEPGTVTLTNETGIFSYCFRDLYKGELAHDVCVVELLLDNRLISPLQAVRFVQYSKMRLEALRELITDHQSGGPAE